MLILLFCVYDDRYTLDCTPVVEIVPTLPTLTLKKLHSAPEYIPGLFNYPGHLVLVIELCSRIQGLCPALNWG
ncbi:chemotaxis protein CheW, partial [Oscillatoria nigro-viridis]|uniref:chemotaxis protein CheW n=1 Tax=Phormidium nigroviride TaxID=482564 RepID=UPI0002F4D680